MKFIYTMTYQIQLMHYWILMSVRIENVVLFYLLLQFLFQKRKMKFKKTREMKLILPGDKIVKGSTFLLTLCTY